MGLWGKIGGGIWKGVKKTGQWSWKGTKVAGQVGLAYLGAGAGISGMLQAVPKAINAVEEEFGGASGPEKKRRALERVIASVLQVVEKLGGFDIDEKKIAAIAAPLIDAWVEWRNVKKWSKE